MLLLAVTGAAAGAELGPGVKPRGSARIEGPLPGDAGKTLVFIGSPER